MKEHKSISGYIASNAIEPMSIKFRHDALAKEIVIYRTMNNGIENIDDLTKIKGMPNEKIKIIALYLDF